MAEKIEPIKSLDELEQGDVVNISPHRQGPYVVLAVGDVPEHEREAVFSRVVSNNSIEGSFYREVTVRESEINRTSKITKLNKEDYLGCKYLTVNTL